MLNRRVHAKKVFKLGSIQFDEIAEFVSKSTWIVSCCAHTMKRFHRCAKANIKDKKTLDLACYSFSLLLNATDLQT